MRCDCSDDVIIEIHHLCEKIFTFLDSSVIQTDAMSVSGRQKPEW